MVMRKRYSIATAGMSIIFGMLFASAVLGISLPDVRRLLFPAIPAPSASPQLGKGQAPPPPEVLPSAESYEAQIVNVVERSNDSVVSIIVSKNLPVIEQYYENPFQEFGIELPPGLGIPQYRQKGTRLQEIGGGTGFVISSDGLILTNRHVVADTEAEYTVLFNDGSKVPAKVVARDPSLDMAVLRVSRSNLKPLALGDSDQVKLGSTAIAIGNALGEFRNTVSVGVISGLARTIQASGGSELETLQNVIQTDAAINSGNSGGPLLNLRGEVIGINTAMVSGAQNIGFAIPINQIKPSILQVKATGTIKVAYIGVRYLIVTPQLSQAQNLPVDYGAWVQAGQGANEPAIAPGSPAEAAGLKSGDIILELNGEKITESNNLSLIIRKYKPGDQVTLKILRGKETLTLRITLGER